MTALLLFFDTFVDLHLAPLSLAIASAALLVLTGTLSLLFLSHSSVSSASPSSLLDSFSICPPMPTSLTDSSSPGLLTQINLKQIKVIYPCK